MKTVALITEISVAKARIAVASFFFVFGTCIGTWAPHIPLAKERLAIGPGWFGAALLCMGFGGIAAMPLVGLLIGKFGSSRVMVWTAAVTVGLLPLPIIAPNLGLFALALFMLGANLGALDVAMNAHGVAVERLLRKPVMSSFHGAFSVAVLLAAGLSSLLIERIPELSRVLLSCITCFAVIVWANFYLLPPSVDQGNPRSPLAIPTRSTVGLGLLCLLALMIEGSVMEWVGILLRENLGASARITSSAVAAYAGGMAVSRLWGDSVRLHFGSASVVRASALLTAASMVLAVSIPDPIISLCAFTVSGFTLGPITPIMLAGGGRSEPGDPGHGIAAVTTLGYLGIVMGPPLIGLLAELIGLPLAFCVMAAFAMIICAFSSIAAAADNDSRDSA